MLIHLFRDRNSDHTENQWTGFCMIRASVMKELNILIILTFKTFNDGNTLEF